MTPQQIRERIDALHKEIAKDIDRDAIALITPLVLKRHAEIMDLTSQLADITSQKLERLTQKLIVLTWALVWLTVALLVFAIFVEIRH